LSVDTVATSGLHYISGKSMSDLSVNERCSVFTH